MLATRTILLMRNLLPLSAPIVFDGNTFSGGQVSCAYYKTIGKVKILAGLQEEKVFSCQDTDDSSQGGFAQNCTYSYGPDRQALKNSFITLFYTPSQAAKH